MKHFLAFFAWHLLAHTLLSGQVALVVALSNYSPLSNWPATNAANDVPLVVNALLRHGFKQENIRVLQDAEATKAGIEKALRSELVEKAVPGGNAVIYFSGHGQQRLSAEDLALELALATFDSPKEFRPGQYQGENLLGERQLNEMLEPLSQKLGAHGGLLFVFDGSCNGAQVRGGQAGRGTDIVMGPPDMLEHLPITPAPSLFTGPSSDGGARVTVLVASTNAVPGAEIPGGDGKLVGAFTYALTKTLNETPPGSTYADLMQGVRRIMSAQAPLQLPGIKGHTDLPVLGDRASALRRFPVLTFDPKTQQVQIQGGIFQGMHPGSEMVFYPSGLPDTGGIKPIATGRVMEADLMHTTVQLEGSKNSKKIIGSEAFFKRRSFGSLQVAVQINVLDSTLAEQLRTQCSTLPFLSLEHPHPDLLVRSLTPDSLSMHTRDGVSLYNGPATEALNGPLLAQIRQFAQAQYFRELELSEPSLRVALDIIPMKVARENRKYVEKARYPLAERTDPAGNIRLSDQEYFKVSVTNTGDRPVYYSVLYILPDNQFVVWTPQQTTQPTDLLLQPGQSRECPNFFSPTTQEGVRVLKVIAAQSPFDLNAVIQNKGQMLRGEPARSWSDIEHFFAETYHDARRLPDLPPGAVHIGTRTFDAGPAWPRKQ